MADGGHVELGQVVFAVAKHKGGAGHQEWRKVVNSCEENGQVANE